MDIFREGKRYFRKGLIFLTIYTGVGSLTFLVRAGFRESSFFLSFLQGLGICAFLFLSLIGTYVFPLIIDKELKTWQIIRQATAFTLDNFWFTLGICLVVILIFVFSTIVVVGVFLFLISLVGIIQNNAYLSITKEIS